jgi:hypothetical protein
MKELPVLAVFPRRGSWVRLKAVEGKAIAGLDSKFFSRLTLENLGA